MMADCSLLLSPDKRLAMGVAITTLKQIQVERFSFHQNVDFDGLLFQCPYSEQRNRKEKSNAKRLNCAI
jgi:hypothetical protein